MPLPHTHWPSGGLPAHRNFHHSACTNHHQCEHRWDCKTRRDVRIKHFWQLGITVQQVLSDKAKRNSLVNLFSLFPQQSAFPTQNSQLRQKLLLQRFILSAQLTRFGSRKLGHRVSTEPAHFREMIWG